MIRPANWNEQIKDVLKDFSDLDFQTEAWNGRGPFCASPDEMCEWPDDFLMEEWVKEHYFLLSLGLQNDFQSFFQQINNLPDEENYADLNQALYSPEWVEIRHLAKSILQQIENIPALQ